MKQTDILVINPGSTTTKIAVFRNLEVLFEETITHDPEKLKSMGDIFGQMEFREELIRESMKKHGYEMACLSAAVGRGGMIVGLHGGGYKVTPKLCEAMRSPENPPHASSMGAELAYSIAEPLGKPAFIYDSTMGCELTEVAKVTGLDGVEKYGCCHVLNSRAQGMNYANSIGRKYEELNLIVAHLGGGISVSAHQNGKIIDESTYDDGPMAPERTGGIPLILWTKLCFSGRYTEKEIGKLISGRGGLMSYLGVTDCREVEKMIDGGNQKAKLVYEAMAYQVSKAIAEMSVALRGNVDAVILTGGAAHSKMLTGMVREYAGHIGEFVLMPGENELEALAKGAQRILNGEEEGRIY
ncbi:MAG: butyrate kinase [Clostridiales bacterium]|nr:MAG: butyrate kinase [Clostridiales bacterium]